MGNVLGAASIPSNDSYQDQQRQNDLRMLGERASFGDDELTHLYDSYKLFWQRQEIEVQSSEGNSSFLYDWYKSILWKDRGLTDATASSNLLAAKNVSTSGVSLPPDEVSPPILHMESLDSSNKNVEIEQCKLRAIKFVIQHILPPNFDVALYKGCFTCSDDPIHRLYSFSDEMDECTSCNTTEANPNSINTRVKETATCSTQTVVTAVYVDDMIVATEVDADMKSIDQETSSAQNPQSASNIFTLTDEYTRTTRLCTFFEALSRCSGRRSSKECVTLLFNAIHLLQNHCEFTTNGMTSPSTNKKPRISSQLLVDTGYRFALALAYIQQCMVGNHRSSDDFQMCLQSCISNDASKDSIDAMAKSIVEKRRRRLNRHRSDWTSVVDSSSNDMESCEHADDDWIELDDIIEWIDAVAPMFPFIVPTFFHYILFPSKTTLPQSRTYFNVPIMDWKTDQTAFQSILSCKTNILSVRNFALACFSPALNGSFFPLYSSNDDGLSFNRLQNSVLGYNGPTLFIIQSESGGIFGAYTATAWKESRDFYGNTDCFLYQLWPRTMIYRPTSNERNFMYCNSTARSHGYDQQAHGIGFGGSVHSPRLFLAENFDDCSASSQDLTFENGPLLPDVGSSGHACFSTIETLPQYKIQLHRSLFGIECLEVWGVGGSADIVQTALSAREINRAQAAEMIRKARKVDKAQFLDDFRSGVISSKTFAHRQQVDGRADVDLDERVKDKDML